MNFARDVVEAAPPRAARAGGARPRRRPARMDDGRGRGERAAAVAARAARAGRAARRRRAHARSATAPSGCSRWSPASARATSCCPARSSCAAKDLQLRLARRAARASWSRTSATPTCCAAAGWDGPTLWCPWDELPARATRRRRPSSAPDDPCLITFTSGTAGEPKAVLHGQRYLAGQRLQAEHWLDARPGELVWCTAASGWSKSARNAFIAPWLRGAAALLHDARFDPHERLELLERERVDVLCMAPTEYRVIAKRAQPRAAPGLRGLVAAGEALDPGVLGDLARGDRPVDPRRLRADGDRPAHRDAARRAPRGPARWAARCRASRLDVVDGELVLDPATDPTFFLRYLGEEPPAGPWRTGDRVHADEDGFLYFEGRTDDVIISAGYRIGPFEVESALRQPPRRRRGRGRRGARRRARQRRPRRRRPARRLRALPRARRRAAGPRQGRDRALQVPAHRRLRRRAAAHRQRQDPPRGAPRRPRPSSAGTEGRQASVERRDNRTPAPCSVAA